MNKLQEYNELTKMVNSQKALLEQCIKDINQQYSSKYYKRRIHYVGGSFHGFEGYICAVEVHDTGLIFHIEFDNGEYSDYTFIQDIEFIDE